MSTERDDFTAEERAAMKEHAGDLRKRRSAKPDPVADLADVITKIDAMAPADRDLATWVHGIITTHAPELAPRTWYGMPAYSHNGKVLCFFQDAGKFKSRYATLGFSDAAALDDSAMWPTSFAIMTVDAAAEQKIRSLLDTALGR